MATIAISVDSTTVTVCPVRTFQLRAMLAIRLASKIVESLLEQLADGHFTLVCGCYSRYWSRFRPDLLLLPLSLNRNAVSIGQFNTHASHIRCTIASYVKTYCIVSGAAFNIEQNQFLFISLILFFGQKERFLQDFSH